MPRSKDYIPQGDAELQLFSANVYQYSTKNCERWKIPAPKEFLEGPVADFLNAKAKFEDPNHGKIDTGNRNTTKAALEKALRVYIQGFLARNPLVTAEDRKIMGIPLYDSTPTTHPVPVERSRTEAVPGGTGAHRVTAIHPDLADRSKPRFVAGVAFARRVRKADEPVSRAEDMPSEFQAGTSREYFYAEADYGKVADYATAYENNSGKRGPWSNVVSLLIDEWSEIAVAYATHTRT